MNRALLFVPLALFLVLTITFGFGLTRDPSILRSVLIDKPLPAFDLPLAGQPDQRISSDTLKGKVVLLNVFASWCIACKVEHPVLLRLKQSGQANIYGLAWKDKPQDLKDWIDENGNPYLQIADDAAGRTAIDLGVTGAPETFVIDAKGRIRYKQIGPIDDYIWQNTLKPMIAQLEAEK